MNTKSIWTFAEQRHGHLHPVSLELLSKGRELADETESELCTLLIGDQTDEMSSDILAHGADKVYAIEHPDLSVYRTDLYIQAAAPQIERFAPDIFIIGATPTGRDFAPALAGRLDTGLTADCTELNIEPETGLLIQTRPAFGGNLMASIKCPEKRPQMTTVRPKIFPMPEKVEFPKTTVEKRSIEFTPEQRLIEILDIVTDTETVSISDADVVVAGGRGVGSAENFQLIWKLADILNGAVGASRAVVDNQWIDIHHQVGQTGRTVRPRLYIACGISGAIQHLAGMRTSETIVAVNNDPEAPIFDIADHCIVADVNSFLPIFIKNVAECKKNYSGS